jgi:long-chain acyl-CoA synthetase
LEKAMTSLPSSAVPSLSNTLVGIPSPLTSVVGGPRLAPGTINALFFDAVERFDRADALMYKVDGVWEPTSHRTILERVRRTALGLARLGIVAQDRVGLLSENRPEWLIADYACLLSSVTDVPIYPTLPGEQIPYILNNSGARAIFVSTPEQARKVAQVRAEAPALQWIIGFAATKADGCDLTLAELEALGAQDDSPERATTFKQAALEVLPEQLVTLIYTSGTTGRTTCTPMCRPRRIRCR